MKLDLLLNKLGLYTENLKYLAEIINHLPNNLNDLEFNLGDNKIGTNPENIKYLAEAIK